MSRFSSESMGAYAALWRPYNDIDIYVEDSTFLGLYERMFEAMLGGLAKVGAIIPLNTRDAVVLEAKRLQNDFARKRFFLVDGDFKWSVGQVEKVRNLRTLKCYSLENFVWNLEGIYAAARLAAPDLSNADIQRTISQEDLDRAAAALRCLFIAYAVAGRLGATCPTVNYPVIRLMTGAPGMALCPSKTQRRILEVYRHLLTQHDLSRVTRERKKVEEILRRRDIAVSHFISGKDYLLPLVLSVFRNQLKFRGSGRQLLSLAMTGRSALEKSLKRAVRRAFTVP